MIYIYIYIFDFFLGGGNKAIIVDKKKQIYIFI